MLQGRLLISPQSTTALQLGRLLNGTKQTSKKLCEATTTPLHTNGCVDFFYRTSIARRYASAVYAIVVCLSVCVRLSVSHTLVLIACSKCVWICLRHSCKNMFYVFFLNF